MIEIQSAVRCPDCDRRIKTAEFPEHKWVWHSPGMAPRLDPYVNIVREDGTLAPDPYPLPGQKPGRKSLDATVARASVLETHSDGPVSEP